MEVPVYTGSATVALAVVELGFRAQAHAGGCEWARQVY